MNETVLSVIQNKKLTEQTTLKKPHKMKLFTAAFKTENLNIMCVPTRTQ